MDIRTWWFIVCCALAIIIGLAILMTIIAMGSSKFTEQLRGTKYDPEVIEAQSKKTPPNPPTPPPTSLE